MKNMSKMLEMFEDNDDIQGVWHNWENEDEFVSGGNFWCKVVFENDRPFAVIALCQYEQKTMIMEVLVAPEKRGRGKGSKMLKELLENGKDIIGVNIQKAEAIIFPSNEASQKAFSKAGFKHESTHEDGDAMNYVYEKTF